MWKEGGVKSLGERDRERMGERGKVGRVERKGEEEREK
jgi:hypothetical protein